MGRRQSVQSSGGTDDAGAIEVLNLELSAYGADGNLITPSVSNISLADDLEEVKVSTFEDAVENFTLSLLPSDLGIEEGTFAFESIVPTVDRGVGEAFFFNLSSLDLTARYLPKGSPVSLSDGKLISLRSFDDESGELVFDDEQTLDVDTIEYGLSSDELRELQIPEFTLLLRDQDEENPGIQFGGLTIDTSDPTSIDATSNTETIVDIIRVLFDNPLNHEPVARLNAYSSSEEDKVLGSKGSLIGDAETTFSLFLDAEDFTLNNYLREDYEGEGQVISRRNASGDSGTASLLGGTHNLSGIYDLELSYFDENDGDAELEILINDTVVGRRILSEDTSSELPTEDNRREFLIKDLDIEPSDTLTIRGTDDNFEWARVDFLELSSNSTSLEAEIFSPEEVGDQIIRLVGEESESNTLSGSNNNLSGIYDLEINNLEIMYVDPDEVTTELEVFVNGDLERVVSLNRNSDLSSENISVVIEDLQIDNFDTLTISSEINSSELVSIDNITISASSFTIEAEDLTLNNYLIEDYEGGGQVISREDASGNMGVVSFSAGDYDLSGTFDIGISYFDENDGEAEIEVEVNNNTVGSQSLIEKTNSHVATEGNRREYIIENVDISSFSDEFISPDIITIKGTDDGTEWARIDNITFYTSDVNTDFNTFDSLGLPDI